MRILVVEDEKDMNRVIVKSLEAEGYCVDFCFDGEAALDYLHMAEYDAVILDVMIPKMDGFTVLKKARNQGISTPILLLTAKADVNNIVHGLDLGADDYMTKPFEFKELFARIRLITRKKLDVHENVYTCGNLLVDCNECTVKREGKLIELSPKEYSVLLYLIRNQNIVVTREQIEANIWDIDRNGSSNLVDVYIRYLRKKIDDGFAFKMIQTIRGVGYILKAEE
ncbi:MAG: response regulator transcription factor [Lachnospiraceae bacterium]|nr:response regulator transcription factor [Lachnospiraceae bacterium]